MQLLEGLHISLDSGSRSGKSHHTVRPIYNTPLKEYLKNTLGIGAVGTSMLLWCNQFRWRMVHVKLNVIEIRTLKYHLSNILGKNPLAKWIRTPTNT